MTQTNPNFDKATQPAILSPSELVDVAKNKIEAVMEVQKEMMQTLGGINHDLFIRAKKEAELASEFVTKLAGAWSVPDATTTYHEWATKEMDLLSADGQQMFEHGEKIMRASWRLFAPSATRAA
jgi:hypothetical protein